MARMPMVTRTVQTTKAKIMCVNTETGETFHDTFTLPRLYKNDNAILNTAAKYITDENIKPVHVADVVIENVRYGMTEDKFISMAEVLPPLGRPSETAQPYESAES